MFPPPGSRHRGAHRFVHRPAVRLLTTRHVYQERRKLARNLGVLIWLDASGSATDTDPEGLTVLITSGRQPQQSQSPLKNWEIVSPSMRSDREGGTQSIFR